MKKLGTYFCILPLLFSLTACSNVQEPAGSSFSSGTSSVQAQPGDMSSKPDEASKPGSSSSAASSVQTQPGDTSSKPDEVSKPGSSSSAASSVQAQPGDTSSKPDVVSKPGSSSSAASSAQTQPGDTSSKPDEASKPGSSSSTASSAQTQPQSAMSSKPHEASKPDNKEETEYMLNIKIGEKTLTATLEHNSSAEALLKMLSDGDVTVHMSDYAGMEKVGTLPESLPRNDEHIDTDACDLILYQGNQFVIYYDTNSWSLTRLGKINNVTQSELKKILGSGDVTVVLSRS